MFQESISNFMIWVMLPFKRALDMIKKVEIFYY